MSAQAPTQKARNPNAPVEGSEPVAVVVAIDDVSLEPWHAVTRSMDRADLANVITIGDAASRLPEAAAHGDILVLLHAGGTTDFARNLLQSLAEQYEIGNPAVLLVSVSGSASPSGAVQTTRQPGMKVLLPETAKALELITLGLARGEMTPLRNFAPRLLDAFRDAARAKNPPSGVNTDDDEDSSTTPGFDRFRQQDFSDLAWQMLEVARRLGQSRPRPQTSTRRLLAAMLLSGLRSKGDDRSGSWLVSQIRIEPNEIRKKISSRYPAVALYKNFDAVLKSQLIPSPDMTERLHGVLETAKRLAVEARPGFPLQVGARHLLGAILQQSNRETTTSRMLRDYQLDVDILRQQLIAQLPAWGLDDDRDAWRSVLEPPDVNIETRLPTYAADSAAGPDLIGIKREVEAMASLVCAWSIEPPLSIGLFGEWGSGKSFFMQKMKERVKQIAIEARKSELPQRDFGYYKNIVQVEFNAWHYVEGNLWASLVEHIFSNLKFEGTAQEDLDSEKNIQARLDKMLVLVRERAREADAKDLEHQQLRQAATEAELSAKAAAAEAEAMKADADRKVRESDEALQKAQQKHANAQNAAEIRRAILLKDAVETVQLSDDVRDAVKAGLAKLGIGEERLRTTQGMREALKEATESGKLIAEGFKLVRENSGWLLLLWAIAVPLTVVVAGFVFDFLASHSNAGWLQRLGSAVSGLFVLMSGAVASWKKLSPQLKPLLDTINTMKAKRIQLEEQVERERENRAKAAAAADEDVRKSLNEAQEQSQKSVDKAAEALKARQDADNKRAEAERVAKEAAEKRALAAATALEADALRPERRIATFIQDRAAAKDYRRHLGVPALIRRDFEKLSAMFETQRRAEEERRDCADGKGNDPTIVNRIILYIDDLDRCPPNKVVDVLRAIHLLLAFRLFVVVVAVDARWMKRSLKDQFSLMLSADSRASNGTRRKDEDDAGEENIAWRATASPDDYLEKIFQVPFWIRPLGRSGSRRLVTELTRHDIETSQVTTTTSGGQPPPASGNGHGAPSGEGGAHPLENQDSPPSGNGSAPSAVARDASTPPAAAKPPEWSPVKADPRMLMLAPEERDYMISLSAVIGRSPRSVKRFVNCYRLLKSTMDSGELARSTRSGTFRTSMLLLGIVTGFPEAAPALLSDLRDAARDQAPEAWAREAAKRLQLEERGKWAELLPAIGRLREFGVKNLYPLADAAELVDRFSFSPVQRPVEDLV